MHAAEDLVMREPKRTTHTRGPRRAGGARLWLRKGATDLRTRLHDWVALRVHRCSDSGAEVPERSLSASARTNTSLPIFGDCAFCSAATTKWFAVRRVLAYPVH